MAVAHVQDRVVIRDVATKCAALVGIVDMSVVFSYLAGIGPAAWYGATLLAKLLLLMTLKVPGRLGIKSHGWFFALFALLITLSCWLSGGGLEIYASAIGFCLHIILSVGCVRHDKVVVYLRSIALLGVIASVVYLGLVATGHITVVYGRYYFFSDAHPNLGSEIFSIACISLGAGYGLRKYFLAVIPLFASVLLMQGRAALLVLIGVSIAKLYLSSKRKRAFVFAVLVCLAIGVVSIAVSSSLRDAFLAGLDSMFMLENKYRGVGTGFVGRSERWSFAWNAFLQSPFVGQGFGYFASRGIDTPHNFYMYALAEFGILSLLLILYLARCAYRGWSSNPSVVLICAPVLILTIFNDRFINLNPYPFVIFVLLLLLGVRSAQAGVVTPRRERMGEAREIT